MCVIYDFHSSLHTIFNSSLQAEMTPKKRKTTTKDNKDAAPKKKKTTAENNQQDAATTEEANKKQEAAATEEANEKQEAAATEEANEKQDALTTPSKTKKRKRKSEAEKLGGDSNYVDGDPNSGSNRKKKRTKKSTPNKTPAKKRKRLRNKRKSSKTSPENKKSSKTSPENKTDTPAEDSTDTKWSADRRDKRVPKWLTYRGPQLKESHNSRLARIFDGERDAGLIVFCERVVRTYIKFQRSEIHLDFKKVLHMAVTQVFTQVRPASAKPYKGDSKVATDSLAGIVKNVLDIK